MESPNARRGDGQDSQNPREAENGALKLLNEKPEYEKILRKLLAHQEKHVERWKEREEDLDIDGPFFGFEYSDVKIQPAKLNFLSARGILEKVYSSSNKPNQYRVAEPEKVKQALEEKKISKKAKQVEPTREESTPENLFSVIEGYEDLKWLFEKSTETKLHHVLLKGPPSTAKTLFLLELGRLPGSEYVLGHSTTGPGLEDQLFGRKPRYVLIDEIDKMDREDRNCLLSLMETGIVKETKSGKKRELELRANVYATANRIEKIPPELLDRFEIFELEEYSDSQYLEVVKKVLEGRESVEPELAEYIASKTRKFKDIRMSIRTARLCQDEKEVDRYISIVGKWRSEEIDDVKKGIRR